MSSDHLDDRLPELLVPPDREMEKNNALLLSSRYSVCHSQAKAMTVPVTDRWEKHRNALRNVDFEIRWTELSG